MYYVIYLLPGCFGICLSLKIPKNRINNSTLIYTIHHRQNKSHYILMHSTDDMRTLSIVCPSGVESDLILFL